MLGCELYLRTYDVAERLTVQDWTVEIRQRLEGKQKGSRSYVFIDKNGKPHYTQTLACADCSCLEQVYTVQQQPHNSLLTNKVETFEHIASYQGRLPNKRDFKIQMVN